MRPLRIFGAGVAILVLSLAASAPASPVATPRKPFAAAPALKHGTVTGSSRRRRPGSLVMGCTTTSASGFVGVQNRGDYAGGNASAVLGGQNNAACDDFTAIAGGVNNVIGYGTVDKSSFIGAGYGNEVGAIASAIGSGQYNQTSGENSIVGAGVDNYAQGISSFVGAGGEEYSIMAQAAVPGGNNIADGADSFVGAGDLNQIAGAGEGSFIGAGGYAFAASGNSSAGNQIAAVDSFIGAGDQNNVDAGFGVIGGGANNTIAFGAGYSVVTGGEGNSASGGLFNFIGAGNDNSAAAQAAFVGAGNGNKAGGTNAFVGAGNANTASGAGAFVGGGGNSSGGSTVKGSDSFVGAGDQNSVAGNLSFIGAGGSNQIGVYAAYAAIAGGYLNAITASNGTIAGGYGNRATAKDASVGGGESNSASGVAATIPGGYQNVASGSESFAAGFGAQAVTNGSFVWSDAASTSVRIKSTLANQFLARASGGVAFYSNAAATSGVRLAAGGGSWSSLSDRTMKTGVTALDDAAVLRKVAALPVSEWSYTSERGVRHVGPMAQDFYAAFGVGEDDRHITSIDEDGVALAAIKALHAENARLRARLERDEGSRAREDARFASLEKSLARLTHEREDRR